VIETDEVRILVFTDSWFIGLFLNGSLLLEFTPFGAR